MNFLPTQKSLGIDQADAAMLRAAQQARHIAMQTGTPLAFWIDGRVVLISPDDERLSTNSLTVSQKIFPKKPT